MTWCRDCPQATSYNLSQCWPRSMSPYGVTRPQWVKSGNRNPFQNEDCLYSIDLARNSKCANEILGWAKCHFLMKIPIEMNGYTMSVSICSHALSSIQCCFSHRAGLFAVISETQIYVVCVNPSDSKDPYILFYSVGMLPSLGKGFSGDLKIKHEFVGNFFVVLPFDTKNSYRLSKPLYRSIIDNYRFLRTSLDSISE